MECITISSDEDDIQVIDVNKPTTSTAQIKTESLHENAPILHKQLVIEGNQSIKQSPDKRNGVMVRQELSTVPVITLEDEDDDNSNVDKEPIPKTELKPTQNKDDKKLSIESSSGNSNIGQQKNISNNETSKNSDTSNKKSKTASKSSNAKTGKNSSRANSEKNKEATKVDNQPLMQKLIDSCRKVEYGIEMDIVARKLWNYFRSTDRTSTEEFKSFLESSIFKVENILNNSRDKFMISRVIKDVINEMKRDESAKNGKLRVLYNLYYKLMKRIDRLEETEVESDDDGGNPYIYLDRYRRKAVDVYNKICELEGRANDADRPTLQRFFFTSNVAPIPIQRALERYYNKTHSFPDFCDVKKLVKKVNRQDNLNLTEREVFKIAHDVFNEFGERLIWRRKYDDYNILVDYLKEGACEDPADADPELEKKLEENKRTRKKEQEILDNYATKEATSSINEIKKKPLILQHLETSTISVSSSSSSSPLSSLATSPNQSDVGESDDDGDNETNKHNVLKDSTNNDGNDNAEACSVNSLDEDDENSSLFSNSEEESMMMDVIQKRKSLKHKTSTSNLKRRKTNDASEMDEDQENASVSQ